MNEPELKQIRKNDVNLSESNDEEIEYCIEYLNQPICNNLRDSILAQILSCERLLIKMNDVDKITVVEREIVLLKLIMDLLEY